MDMQAEVARATRRIRELSAEAEQLGAELVTELRTVTGYADQYAHAASPQGRHRRSG